MFSRQESLKEVIGKTICSVVFRSGWETSPETQLFLVFEDDTYFELFGQEIGFVQSLSQGDTGKAVDYARKFSQDVLVLEYPAG